MQSFGSGSDEEDNNMTFCKICIKSQAQYTCPKCGINYCSVPCYQSRVHSQCSEEFYRRCVTDTLAQEAGTAEAENRMKEILMRCQQSIENCDEVDSGDESEEDLANRLHGIDLEDAEAIWEKLTKAEKQEFTELVKTGNASTLLPPWKPWWNFRKEKKLVVEIENPVACAMEADTYKENCPKLKEGIQILSSITKCQPSPLVKCNIQNVLAAYCYVCRWFNGEHISFATEAAQTLMSLSCNLSQGNNYCSVDLAVEAVVLQISAREWLNCTPESFSLMQQDLEAILCGPENSNATFYLLAAMSDIYALLCTASKIKAKPAKQKSDFAQQFPHYPNEAEKSYFAKQMLKQAAKKIEYYMSWIKEYGTDICLVGKASCRKSETSNLVVLPNKVL